MDSKTFDNLVKAARERQDKILKQKGDDYTVGNADSDRLYNFKFIAQVLGLTTEQVWAVYFLKHVLALCAHTKGITESEPIQGRMDDTINYVYLLDAIVADKSNGSLPATEAAALLETVGGISERVGEEPV
jgi:hypothetical protein